MDARDGIFEEDSIGSAKPPGPPKPVKPHDPERAKRQLLQVIAAAAVVTAVFSGITAWETHEHRTTDKALYCTAYAGDVADGGDEYNEQQKQLRDALSC